jgi:leucyl/phenylalanyl-tRNA--protein transferase
VPDPDPRELLELLFARLYGRRVVSEPPPFPAPETADAYGCVTFGTTLTPELVLEAYPQGIFPMAEPDGSVGWWCPDPRTILDLEDHHVPRRLRRTLRQGRFEVRVDTAFEAVIAGCADRDETWIDEAFVDVYTELHRRGVVHSVEAWQGGELAGGLYGLAFGGAFMAESMFHRVRDASKVAVVGLIEHLRARAFVLLDIQYETKATAIFRPKKIRRRDYLARLQAALALERSFVEEA